MLGCAPKGWRQGARLASSLQCQGCRLALPPCWVYCRLDWLSSACIDPKADVPRPPALQSQPGQPVRPQPGGDHGRRAAAPGSAWRAGGPAGCPAAACCAVGGGGSEYDSEEEEGGWQDEGEEEEEEEGPWPPGQASPWAPDQEMEVHLVRGSRGAG